MDVEGRENPLKKESWRTVLTLAYQSLGVVYGDLSTSPLYVYKSTFAEDIHHSESNEEIYGVLSFVFWTLTLIPLLKYVFIVLRADDNGEGGTFALYSLLCRHARVSTLPNGQVADEELYEYKKDGDVSANKGFGLSLRSTLEKHKLLQRILLVLALIGACMVIGDGVLTPAISVFSAVSGLELSIKREHHQYVEVPVACVILVFLFFLQHYGTHRIGFLFAPVVITWLSCISAIGLYNIFHWNPHVYQALSPYYMYKFLKKTQKGGWMSLGGILLCITGSEAMYADLGHFSQLSIKTAFTFVVYPSLILAYMGQAAYLSKHHIIESDYRIGFYVSVPEKIRWPVLAIAILAAVVGSQAIITGTFSIIKQCSALGCFPRVKIIHTSSKVHGQIYIPEINWTLMLLCLAVTIGFRETKHISNAAGLAVITVMLVTTCLMSLVIVLCWRRSVFLAVCFIFFFGSIEALYFSASLIKFLEGAWVPVALSFIFLIIMYIWHYGTMKKYEFDVQNKVSIQWLLGLGANLGIARVHGIGLIHTELVSGIPAIFSHFVTNLPAFHQVVVFLCIKSVPVPHVRPEERFLVGRVGPKKYRLYRCIVRYGYRDIHMDDVEFEKDLVCSIAEFIRSEVPEYDVKIEDFEDDERMTVIGTTSANSRGIKLCEYDEDSSEVTDVVELREISSLEVPMKKDPRAPAKGMPPAPYQRPHKSIRPPLIPPEGEYEKPEEGLFGSLGWLFANTGSSVVEIFGALFSGRKKQPFHHHMQQHYHHTPNHANSWPKQESFVIPDEDEPPAVESRDPTPRKIYPVMTKDLERSRHYMQNQPFYGGWDGDVQQQQQHKLQQLQKHHQHHQKHQSARPQTYYEQNCETNEIVFGAVQVQEQDGRREAMVIKAVDYGDPIYNNIRSRYNYMGYSCGY